jgi:hypothetical protein
LARIPECLKAIYRDQPGASYPLTFGLGHKIAVLYVPADSSRRDP